MLEAGPLRDQWKDFVFHEPFPYKTFRGFKKPVRAGHRERALLFIKNSDEPYTTAAGQDYEWFRARNVGGARCSGALITPFTEIDLKGYSTDATQRLADLLQDVEPYYDKVERLSASAARGRITPNAGQRYALAARRLEVRDYLLKRASEKIGIPVIRARRAMLSKDYNGYKACHYCAGCDNGCETHSFFNSAFRVVVPLMEKYPRTFKLIPNAMARSIDVNARGVADGVTYVDRTTGQTHKISARAVVAACGTLETTRLMLLSTSPQFPREAIRAAIGHNFQNT